VSSSTGSWTSGRSYCKNKGGAYVKITSYYEWLFVRSMMSASTWIGLNDRSKEGKYRWDSDNSSASYTKWSKGEPNNSKDWYDFWGDGEDCVEMNSGKSYYYNDVECDKKRRYACERSASITKG